MLTINDLPNELLQVIVAFTDNSTIPAFARASRRFHKLANPRLYDSVQFVESGAESLRRERPLRHGTLALRSADGYPDDAVKERLISYSQIISLSRFLRTLAASRSLRFEVFHLSIQWTRETSLITRIEGDVRALLYLLSPSLRKLYISSPDPNYGIPPLPQLFELDLNYRYTPTAHICRLDRLTYLVHLPSLRRLTVWNSRYNFGQVLQKMVERTPNLLSLRLDIDHIPHDDAPHDISHDTQLSDSLHSALVSGLSGLKGQLEELFITHLRDVDSNEYPRHDFRDFTALKRLAIGHSWGSKNDLKSLDEGSDLSSSSSLWDIMPVGIEELILNTTMPPHVDSTRQELEDDPGVEEQLELTKWQAEILCHKQTHFPSLRRVVVWDASWQDVRRLRLRKDICERIVLAFRAAQIEFQVDVGTPERTPFVRAW